MKELLNAPFVPADEKEEMGYDADAAQAAFQE